MTDSTREIINEINALEKQYVDILRQSGLQVEYSFLEYDTNMQEAPQPEYIPTPLSTQEGPHQKYVPTTSTNPEEPQPKYIPKRIPKIIEPPIVFGPPVRIRRNREDPRSRTKRELELICSIIELEGETPQRLEEKAHLINQLNTFRSEYRRKRRINKAKRKIT